MTTKLMQILFWSAVALCLAGIFLPWEIYGTTVPVIVYGIQISPRLADHGGLELLIMLGYHIFTTLQSPLPPEKAGLGYLMSAVLLILSALYFTGRWFLHSILAHGPAGSPTLGIGLALVLAGSILLVALAMLKI
jgi:hypothetical protein